jgi:hypothetical protein
MTPRPLGTFPRVSGGVFLQTNKQKNHVRRP